MSSGHTVRDRAEIYSLRKSQAFDFSLCGPTGDRSQWSVNMRQATAVGNLEET